MSVFDRFRVDGKKLLITGGSRGLGREMVLAIAEAGADVIVTGRREDSLKQIAKEVEHLGRQCWTIQADMNAPDECERVCENVIAEHGSVDILINNVGGRREDIPTEEMSLAKWRELMDLNLTSTFVCTSRIGKAMIVAGNGGRVINIGSINSLVAGRNIAGRHYETAKGAILQFTRSVAADWAPYGITVNAILPGGFMTEPNKKWAREKPDIVSTFRAQIPMGDHGQPEDLGPLALYLASDASRYMTGAGLVIDGGYTCW
ncbi:MAG: short-chain dehydrogenase [Planctomycetaceae bacterium]|nr:short-chain dehydrogenase [Planctomycetaceae bacterium]|tara:strand:- start:244 stop:1026 length:783 start_codon:yes stop_codon:yes gene_type:complete